MLLLGNVGKTKQTTHMFYAKSYRLHFFNFSFSFFVTYYQNFLMVTFKIMRVGVLVIVHVFVIKKINVYLFLRERGGAGKGQS